MGTKTNPGKFDCYNAAGPDEPMFTLLARDPLAGHMVSLWANVRRGDTEAAEQIFNHMIRTHGLSYCVVPDADKAAEATECAMAMFRWREEHRPNSTTLAPTIPAGRIAQLSVWGKRATVFWLLTF